MGTRVCRKTASRVGCVVKMRLVCRKTMFQPGYVVKLCPYLGILSSCVPFWICHNAALRPGYVIKRSTIVCPKDSSITYPCIRPSNEKYYERGRDILNIQTLGYTVLPKFNLCFNYNYYCSI